MTAQGSLYEAGFEAICHPNRGFEKHVLPRELPCRDGAWQLARAHAQGFCEAYPHLPCAQIFWMIAAWLAANPGKRPYSRNMEGFVSRWFSREDASYEDDFIGRWYRLCHAS